MGHIISHEQHPYDVDRDMLNMEIRAEQDSRGDGWTGPVRWAETTVYPSRKAAEDAVADYDGEYINIAVPFRDVDAVEVTSQEVIRAKGALARLEAALMKCRQDGDIRKRQVDTVTCPVCGSRIKIHKMVDWGNQCPVCCQGDLRTKSVQRREQILIQKVQDAQDQLNATLERVCMQEAPLCWLVKTEYHR